MAYDKSTQTLCSKVELASKIETLILKNELKMSDHVYYRWTRSTYRATVDRYIGRLSVDYRSTIGRLSVDYRPIVDR